jgi:hypothetical protein
MNRKRWTFVGVGVVALILVIALIVGVVFLVQRLGWGYGPGYAASYIFHTPFGPGARMEPGYAPGPMYGRGSHWSGPMHRGFMGRGAFGPGPRMGRGYGYGPMFGRGPYWGDTTTSLLTVAAEQLGMTSTELMTELQSGKSIAEVAKAREVSLDTIVDAFTAPYAEQLAEMVTNEVLTQEQVDSLLTTVKARLTLHLSEAWNPGGSGWGNCPGSADVDGDGVCDYGGGPGPRPGWGGGNRWRGRW